MKGKWILITGLAILILAAGLVYGGATAARRAYIEVTTEKRGDDTTPAQVVTDFYNWLLGYARGAEGMRNPVVDRAYRSSEYLTEAFIAEVDETVASSDGGCGDPFLLAQDIPERFTVGEVMVLGDRATVALSLYWGGNPTPSPRQVHLDRIDGEWKIAGVSIPEL